MTITSKSPSRGFFQAACALSALAAPVLACAQTQDHQAPTTIDQVVVSATRTPQDPRTVPSSVTLVSLGDLDAAQIDTLAGAFDAVPGVNVVNTGAVGGQSSLFIRGASSHQTLLVVDGIRMNDRSAQYQNFLGGAGSGGFDRIEVLRGPQGTLYGSSAMGGVVVMDTAHGCGKPTGSIGAGYGSFETYSGHASVKGGTRNVGYSASLAHTDTENDRDYNAFRTTDYSARLEVTPFESLLIGTTVRGTVGDYEEAGTRLYNSPGYVESESNLVTAYARYQPVTEFSARMTLGYNRRDYLYTTTYSSSHSNNDRRIADLQCDWKPVESFELVGGVTRELAENLGGGLHKSDNLTAGYLSATATPVENLQLIGGLRRDEFHTYGGSTTWRTGASYLVAPSGTTFRATYGTGFTAPNTDDVYGVPSWGMIGNPNLQPETSDGWDVGVEQSLASGKVTVGVTYFNNQYENLLEWSYTGTNPSNPYEGMMVNRARASTDGVETFVEARILAGLVGRVSYTYLEAVNDADGSRLTRRPRHVGDAELRHTLTKEWILGAGVHFTADRTDGTRQVEDYTTVRLFTSYDLPANLRLKFRVENLLDEQYEEVYGYPALPIAYYGGVEWRF